LSLHDALPISTRGNNKLDRIYVTEPCYDNIKVVKSMIRSDHLAIVAYNGKVKQAINKTSVKTLYRKRTPAQHALLLSFAPSLIHEFAIATSSVQIEFDQFYSTLTSI